jgi:putative membrane protein
MKLIMRILIMAAALWAAIWIVPGLEFDGGVLAFFIVSILMVVANFIVKPILNLLSAPFILLTFGLFLLITNALVLQLVVWLADPDRFDLGLTSSGFFWATFMGALVMSVTRMILDRFE